MPVDRDSCELLRAIVRRPFDAQRICRLAGDVRDWDSLLKVAREHGVLPMLFLRLADLDLAVPPAAQEYLRAEYHRNVFHSLANAAELIAVLEAFGHEQIPAMPYKGVVLGASVYGDLTIRPAGDLDLLIQHQHLARATALLLERGYQLTSPLHADGTLVYPGNCEYGFERPSDGMVIELRWRLTEPRFRRNLGIDWVWSRRRVAMLVGAEVPDLSPETALLNLSMHGSKHTWSRAIWICDVAQLLAASPGLDWKEVTQESKRLGLWRTLALGVLLANRVVGASIPQAVLRRFESDATASSLAKHVQENLFDARGIPPTGGVPYNVRLLGLHDRMRLLLSLEFMRPNKRDRAAIHLPPALDALYYLVRPFRILWDRSAR
jgi:Uncharacterised nucleotidyltransferase